MSRTQVGIKPNSDDEGSYYEVERTNVPEVCTKGAEAGDLLEINYVGRFTNGTAFDKSQATTNGPENAGRGGDLTLYFVLGQQPPGQFPPGWDIGLLGMCVGERRILRVPSLLAYGAKVIRLCSYI